MFLLDTNVISELRRPEKANKRVLAWAETIPTTSSFLSVISILEIEIGVLQLSRNDSGGAAPIRTWIDSRIIAGFGDRILPVDSTVARRCAGLLVPHRQAERDAMIAATALVHGLTVVTRNVRDFQSSGVALLNPWELQSI